MQRAIKWSSLLALVMWGNAALAQEVIATAYSGDNFTGQAFAIRATGPNAMDTHCGPVLGLGSDKTLGFRPRSLRLAPGYQARLQGWYGNAGDDHCRGPSYTPVALICTNSKNIYDAGCLDPWIYGNVGGSLVIEKVPTPQTDPSVIATAYSGDNFTGQAVAIRTRGSYAMDTVCGPVLGLNAWNTLSFRPRSLKLAPGYQAKLQGWHGNAGDDHCRGPSYSLIAPTCTNSKNIYDPGCLDPWVYGNVGGALIIQ